MTPERKALGLTRKNTTKTEMTHDIHYTQIETERWSLNTRSKRPPHASYHLEISVVWGPDASYTLVETGDGFLGALELLSAGFLEQIRLLQDLFRFHISNAYSFLSSVDIVTFDHWMFVRPW